MRNDFVEQAKKDAAIDLRIEMGIHYTPGC